MPTPVTEVSTFTATIQTPNDGDAANAASFLGNFVQGLTNRSKYLKDAVDSLNTYITALLNFTNGLDATREIKNTVGSGVANLTPHITTGSYADVSGSATTVACAAGDEIYLNFSGITYSVTGSGNDLSVRLVVSSASQTLVVAGNAEGTVSFGSAGKHPIAVSGKHTAIYAETYTVKVQIKESGSPAGSLTGGWDFRATRVEPH